MDIYAAKQVGTLYYMVSGTSFLIKILQEQRINMSENYERNSKTGKNQLSVSFSRDPEALYRQNSNRWHIGLILDGTQLSEKYAITPYSHSGTSLEDKYLTSKNFKILYIAAYDDNTYTVRIVGWGAAKPIPKSAYEELKQLILEHEKNNYRQAVEKEKLTKSTGKRRRKGKMLIEKYLFNNPVGSNTLPLTQLSDSTKQFLAKAAGINQFEERIWGPDSEGKTREKDEEAIKKGRYSLNISKSVKGVVVDEEDYQKLKSGEDEEFKLLDDLLISRAGSNYEIHIIK